MATLTDLLPAFDSACQPIVAALKASGPCYLNSDGGAIWLLSLDPGSFAGFRGTGIPKASTVLVPNLTPSLATPAAATT